MYTGSPAAGSTLCARASPRSVVASGLALVAIGIAGSLLLLRSLGTPLFRVTPYDVPTYAIVVVLLEPSPRSRPGLPGRRAARIEPLTALRQE